MKTSTCISIKQCQALLVFLLWTLLSTAQAANYTKHTVSKGETITQIALKYAVTPFDIYRLNPDSQTGIKENDVLLVPKSVAVKQATPVKTLSSPTMRIVQPKETWYSLSKEVGLSVEELVALNPKHPELKIGDTILISGPTTGNEELLLEKMLVNGKENMLAKPGDKVTFETPFRIRLSDKLYKIVE